MFWGFSWKAILVDKISSLNIYIVHFGTQSSIYSNIPFFFVYSDLLAQRRDW